MIVGSGTDLRAEILDRYRASPVSVLATMLSRSPGDFKEGRTECVTRCPFADRHPNGDRHPSCSFNLRTGQFLCRSCDARGDVFTLEAELAGLDCRADFARVLARLAEKLGATVPPSSPPPAAATEPVTDAEDLGPVTDAQVRALIRNRRITKRGTLDAVGARLVRAWGEEWLGYPTLAGGWKLFGLDGSGRPRLDERGKVVRKNAGSVSIVAPLSLRERNGHSVARLYDVEGESDFLAALDGGAEHVITNTGGAESLSGHKLHREWFAARLATDAEVVIVRDLDDAGRKGAAKAAVWWREQGYRSRVPLLPGDLGEGGDLRDYLLGRLAVNGRPAVDPCGTFAQLEELAAAAPVTEPLKVESKTSKPSGDVWSRAVPVCEFVTREVREADWIVPNVLARGAVTVLASPRGLGKSHKVHALAIAVATGGTFCGETIQQGRVLIVDRDNPAREIKRRLTEWGGANAPAENLRLLTRDDAPPLTDAAKWATFPFADYDVVILDSLSSSTEGVEEAAGGATGEAIAPLLDLARRGPAVLVLANTRKDAAAIRGSGVIGDRMDIVLEVRDATEIPVDPKHDVWWDALPDGGDATWSARSKRRRRRDDYRLALVPSKFRIGEEPDPWAVELRLEVGAWSIRDVTAELEAALADAKGEAATERRQKIDEAVATLAGRIRERHAAGKPVTLSEAQEILCAKGLTRSVARTVRDEGTGRSWERSEGAPTNRRGARPVVLVPMGESGSAALITPAASPHGTTPRAEGISAGLAAQGRREFAPSGAAKDAASRNPELAPPTPGIPTRSGASAAENGMAEDAWTPLA